jgi:hypothetical protein
VRERRSARPKRSRLETIVRQLEAGEADGLDGEIAALRLTLARLLRETEDPVRLADGVARAVGAILKAWQLEHQRDGADASLSEVSARLLDGLDAGDERGGTAGGGEASQQRGGRRPE